MLCTSRLSHKVEYYVIGLCDHNIDTITILIVSIVGKVYVLFGEMRIIIKINILERNNKLFNSQLLLGRYISQPNPMVKMLCGVASAHNRTIYIHAINMHDLVTCL